MKNRREEPPSRYTSETYYAEREFSLLAPVWYSVAQTAYSPQSGWRGNVFSKDPENGANRYSPELDTTCFTLLMLNRLRRRRWINTG